MPHRTPTDRLLREYLGRVRSHLPVRSGGDVVRELESSILDRADGIAATEGGSVDREVMQRALAQVGEPETVASSFAPPVQVVRPEHGRLFLVWTAIAFAVHLVLVGVATTMDRAIHFGPLAVSPIGPHGIVSLAAAVVHALLLDVGLMVCVFATSPWIRRLLRPRVQSFSVDAAPKSAGQRAVLAVLAALILGVFRDDLFVVVDAGRAHPLFTPWFSAVVPFVLVLLGLAVLVDLVYLAWGERRSSLAFDAVHGAATLAVMVHLLRGEAILQVPPVAAFDPFRAPVNGFLADLGTLVLVTLAVIAAVKTVRRLVRFSQL